MLLDAVVVEGVVKVVAGVGVVVMWQRLQKR